MFESMVGDSPQWAGHWDKRFANCPSYFRVRDLSSGRVIINITETCNHAFGAAFVETSAGGIDTLFIFGTPWARYQSRRDYTSIGSSYCSDSSNCTIAAFWSNDPSLQKWNARFSAARPNVSVYNNDVTHVAAPSTAMARQNIRISGLPEHQWIMVIEAGPDFRAHFALSNSSDPTDPNAWSFLDPNIFIVPQFGHGDIGQGPSIRYDPATGYYYVLTGGNTIRVLRSANLRNWTLATKPSDGSLLAPDKLDCIVAPAMYAHYVPTGDALKDVEQCQSSNSSTGFGNDSDVDLTEIVVNGTIATLLQYGSGDQRSFGFSNLAIYYGGMFDLLGSMF